MGQNQSSSTITNSSLNAISATVMNSNSTAASATSTSSNDLTIAGNTGGKISNINQSNAATINVSALIKAVTSNQLQADLISKISDTVTQTQPLIQFNSKMTQDVKNIVENRINTAITVENMQSISNTVANSNSMKILANTDTDISFLTQRNESTMITSLMSDTNSKIIADLKSNGLIKNDTEQSTASILGGGGMTIIIILIILAAVGGGLWYVSSNGQFALTTLTQPPVLALIACVLAFFAYESLKPAAPAKTS